MLSGALLPICTIDMDWRSHLTFASDAEFVGLGGAAFLIAAVLASVAERRRIRRARIDRVGWVPWTSIFLICAVIGITMIGLGVMGLLKAAS